MISLQETLTKVKDTLESTPDLLKDEDIERADLMYQKGVQAFNKKDYEEALEYFTVAVMLLPFNAAYSFALAMNYHILNEEREAIGFYIRSWFLEASNPAACFRLGQCYCALNDYASATEATKTAILLSKAEPRYKELLALSNKLLKHIKQQEEANFIEAFNASFFKPTH